MNRDRAARAYNLISEGFAELALAISEGNEQPAAGAAAPPQRSPAAADDMPEFPPLEEPRQLQDAHVNTALSKCPVHKVAWTIKPAGTSKAGKPYSAFWKCSERDADGYCSQKPVKAWQDSHPIPSAA